MAPLVFSKILVSIQATLSRKTLVFVRKNSKTLNAVRPLQILILTKRKLKATLIQNVTARKNALSIYMTTFHTTNNLSRISVTPQILTNVKMISQTSSCNSLALFLMKNLLTNTIRLLRLHPSS